MNEIKQLKAELERVNGFREKTGRRLREKSDALQEALARLAITNDQLERVKKQAAAMREALEHCLEVTSDPAKYGRFITVKDRDIVRQALKQTVDESKATTQTTAQ